MARIAIDLTPVLPGGDNGGAKVLVLSLIRDFKKISPEYSFILLTAKCSHDELSFLDGQNVKRVCVLGCETKKLLSISSRIPSFFSKLLFVLAEKIQTKIGILGYWLHRVARMLRPKLGLLEKLGADILFCPFTDPRHAESGIPTVSVVHDLQHRDYPQFFAQEEIQGREIFFYETIKKADLLICVSEFTRKTLITHFKIKADRTKTIHNSIHTRLRMLVEEQADQILLGLSLKGRQYMFYPANYWPHKNHRMLLTAFKMLLERQSSCSLDLALTGALKEEEKELRFAVKQMGIENKVHFLGYLTDKELAAVWIGCQFLIFPSLYEGFGIPVLEAMTLGKPVLCSNVTSLPEVAGDAALLFDPRKPNEIVQGIERILCSPDLATSLVEKGLKRAASFKEEDMARQYLEVFESLVGKGKKYQNSITGIYSDRWIGADFNVAFEKNEKDRVLLLSICMPEFVPSNYVSIKTPGFFSSKKWCLSRGEEKTIKIPLPHREGEINFSIQPTFIPTKHGISEDDRRLGIIVNKCAIHYTGNNEEDLIET